MTTRPLYASSTSPVTWLRACWRRLARRRVTPEKSLVTTMDSRVKTRNSRVMTTLNRNIITTEPRLRKMTRNTRTVLSFTAYPS